MIVVTGAYGFIGSCLVSELAIKANLLVLAVDDFSRSEKIRNLPENVNIIKVGRQSLWKYLADNNPDIQWFIHLGARTDTVEKNEAIFDKLNLAYSKNVWNYCTENQIPLIYASSAATYGDGEYGFVDNHALIPRLKPMNPYGWSKQEFDLWVLSRSEQPPSWVGLKFFNVYGPNESHKGRMASVIYHAYMQIKQKGYMTLFKSHRDEIADGEQTRDFVYVKDVIYTITWLMSNKVANGIYNLGSGKARSFRALTEASFEAMGKSCDIKYIDTPIDIRDNYQYYTQASMEKLSNQGLNLDFTSLEKGVRDYIINYLLQDNMYYDQL
jgi:ADP-L-glycero-D-manno-heptose 6-epimerase